MSEDQVATTPEVPQTNGPVVSESFAQSYRLRKIAGKLHCLDCGRPADTLPHVCKPWGAR